MPETRVSTVNDACDQDQDTEVRRDDAEQGVASLAPEYGRDVQDGDEQQADTLHAQQRQVPPGPEDVRLGKQAADDGYSREQDEQRYRYL